MISGDRYRAFEELPVVTHWSANVWVGGRERCEVSQTQLMGYYMSREGGVGCVCVCVEGVLT